MSGPRLNAALAGAFLVVVVVPLAFLPMSWWPFADSKLFVLAAAVVVMWFARLPADRSLGLVALAYVGVAAVATLTGVDRWNSVVGAENQSTGLILIATTAFLVVEGRSLPRAVSDRLPWWLVNTAAVAAAIEILYRFAPGIFDAIRPSVSFVGSTLGQQGALTGFMAVAIAVLPGLPGWSGRLPTGPEGAPPTHPDRIRAWWPWAALVLLATGLSLAAERSGWVALVVGFAVCVWRARPQRWLAARIGALTVAVVAAWTVLNPLLHTAVPLSAAARFAQLGANTSFGYRLTLWRVLLHAVAHRPLLGWGPSNTFSAFLSTAGAADVAHIGRGWGDAHDILLEKAVTLGLLGLTAFAVLAIVAMRRMRRAPTSLGWAAAAAATLFVNALAQPIFVSLAPLLWLLAGVAGSHEPVQADMTRSRTRGLGRVAVVVGLAACLALSASALAASVFEAVGQLYNSEWALRASLAAEPWRVTSAEALSLSLALDGRSGDRAAARKARSEAAGLVRSHPWNPGVRLNAAAVDLLLSDPNGARAWALEQLRRFPGDDAARRMLAEASALQRTSTGPPSP